MYLLYMYVELVTYLLQEIIETLFSLEYSSYKIEMQKSKQHSVVRSEGRWSENMSGLFVLFPPESYSELCAWLYNVTHNHRNMWMERGMERPTPKDLLQ